MTVPGAEHFREIANKLHEAAAACQFAGDQKEVLRAAACGRADWRLATSPVTALSLALLLATGMSAVVPAALPVNPQDSVRSLYDAGWPAVDGRAEMMR